MGETNKSIKMLCIPLGILLISLILPQFIEVEAVKIYSIGILLAGLALWVTDIIPMSISTIFLICLLPLLGIMDFNEAIANIGVNTSLFIMASSGITIALSGSQLPKWIVNYILSKTNANSILLILLLGYVITVCSGFMSSLATCTLFYSILSTAFKEADENMAKTSFYKIIMLMIPACAGIGGFISPAGTPANILLIDILAKEGINITFFQWCVIGFPTAMIATTLFLGTAIMILKPEKDLKFEGYGEIKLSLKDKYTFTLILMIIIGWFMSSWVDGINTTMIAVWGLAIMFIPKLDILDMEGFQKGVNWDLVITMGTVSVLMMGISKTGVLEDIVNSMFGNMGGMNVTILLIVISFVICVMRSFIPTTTAVVTLFSPFLLSIAERFSIHPVTLMMTLAFWAASALLILYTEPIYLITYKERVYTEKDLLKVGVIPSLIMCIITVLFIPMLLHMVGIIGY